MEKRTYIKEGAPMKISALALLLGCLLVLAVTAGAQSHIGIMLSGHEDNCQITHNGKAYDCDDRRQIYLGDTIRKKPSMKVLKIKWAPYVRGVQRSETLLEAAVDRPETLKGKTYAGAAKRYLQDFVKPEEYNVTSAVTRGPKYRHGLPERASLIQGFPVLISPEGMNIDAITILAADGKKVFDTPVQGGGLIVLAPERLPLAPGQTYSVQLRGEGSVRTFTAALLDRPMEDEVLQGLADIDGEKLSGGEAVVRKAAYLQMISDLYPATLDLYWLSFQLLRDSRATLSREQEEAATALRERFYSHRSGKE